MTVEQLIYHLKEKIRDGEISPDTVVFIYDPHDPNNDLTELTEEMMEYDPSDDTISFSAVED